MDIWKQYLLVIVIFQGLTLFFALSFGSQKTRASKVLGVWLLAMTFSFADVFFKLTEQASSIDFLLGWAYFIPASFGPFVYLYTRSVLHNNTITAKDTMLFWPLFVVVFLNWDILTADFSVKMSLLKATPPNYIGFKVSILLIFLQAFAYLFLSFKAVIKKETYARQQYSHLHPSTFVCLKMILVSNLMIWLLKLSPAMSSNLMFLSQVADVLILGFILVISLLHLFYAELFNIHVNESNTHENKLALEQSQRTLQLSTDARKEIMTQIHFLLSTQKLYRKPKLSLSQLAQENNISQHHLSEAINQETGSHFYDLVNQYRVTEICDNLKAGSTKTLTQLFTDAGFSNRSTFNSVFKHFTGMTPSSFKKLNTF